MDKIHFLIPTSKDMQEVAACVKTPMLSPRTEAIVTWFAEQSVEALASFYRISLKRATEEKLRWESIARKKATLYRGGDMWDGLMYRSMKRETWDTQTLQRAEERVYLVSALYGVVPYATPMAPHRLDWAYHVPIDAFYNEAFLESAQKACAAKTVVSLLSSEFEKAFPKELRRAWISIAFARLQEGKYKKHSTTSKKGRGAFLRAALEANLTTKEEIPSLKVDGFYFDCIKDGAYLFVMEEA